MTLAADIGELADKIVRELLLDHEVPILVVEVLAAPVDCLRAVELVLRIEEGCERIGQSREVRRGKRVPWYRALGRIAEVVILVAAVVDAEPAPERSLPMEDTWSPCHADSRAEILRVGIVVGRAFRTEAAATRDVDHGRAVQNLVDHRIELVAETEIEGEVRGSFELVLRVALIESTAVAYNSLQTDPHDVGAELESMAAAYQRQIVDVRESGSDLGIEGRSAHAVEGRRRHTDVQRRGPVTPVVVVRAVQSELRLVDGGGREDALQRDDSIRGDMRNHVVGTQRVSGPVDVDIVSVIAGVHRHLVVEAVVEPDHACVLAYGVGSHLIDLIGGAVERLLAGGVCVQNRLERRRRRQNPGAERCVRHEVDERHAQVLSQAFVVGEEKRLVLLDGAAQAGAELVQRKRRNRCAVERGAGIESVVAERVERAAVILVRASLRDHVDLGAARRAALGGIDRRTDAKLGDGVECDVQPGLGLLGLLLNAVVVDAVEGVVGVIDGMPVEADTALGAVAVVDGPGSEQHQAGPVPSADGKLFDLLRFNQPADLGRGPVHRFQGRRNLDGLGKRADFQPGIDRPRLADGEIHALELGGFESLFREGD